MLISSDLFLKYTITHKTHPLLPIIIFLFSHIQLLSVTLAIVSVVVVVVVGVTFFGFSTFLEPLHGFASNLESMLLGWTPTKFVKIWVLPLFVIELWVILCNVFANS